MKRTRLRPMSKKRRGLLKQRAAVRAEAIERDEREDGRCSGADAWPDIECWGIPEANEIVRRSQWADGWLELDNIVILCTAHHRFVTEHPAEAFARGFQKHREAS